MSRNPLLARSVSTQGTGSYGRVPDFSATDEALDHDGVDGIKGGDRENGKSSAVGAETAADGSHPARYRRGSRSGSREAANGAGLTNEGNEAGSSREETIDVDGDDSDENPPDDSP